METELGPVSIAVWDDRRASFHVVESVVRAGCSRLWLNTINNSTCNILYYLRAHRCQWEFCLNSRQITGPYSLSCLMKYHSPTYVAEADNEVAAIRGRWGEVRGATASPLPEGPARSGWRVPIRAGAVRKMLYRQRRVGQGNYAIRAWKPWINSVR